MRILIKGQEYSFRIFPEGMKMLKRRGTDMVKRFRFGRSIETEAVVNEAGILGGRVGASVQDIPGFLKVTAGTGMEEGSTVIYEMGERDAIYGLGENVRGINKRGWLYESNCTDDCIHTESKHSLYAAHNFFLVDGRERFAIFVDAPQKIVFDMGFQERSRLADRKSVV